MVSLVMREGLSRDFADTDQVFLIGNPAFYGRFGFAAERSVAPPFPLSEDWREAWQSIALRNAAPWHRGMLSVPPAWNEPSLWTP